VYSDGEGSKCPGSSRHFLLSGAHALLLVLLGTGLLTQMQHPAAAVSPYDLFFQADSAALAGGGGDVPGQITGRPQVRRPTGLPETDHALVRLDYCSQTPLVLRRGGITLGRWHSDVRREQYISPLGRTEQESGWTLGLQRQTTNDHIWYDFEEKEYTFQSCGKRYTSALAYAAGSGWRVGGAYGWGKLSAAAQGKGVADILGLPAGTTQWPTLRSDDRSYALGLARVTPEWEAGIQHDWSEPTQTLHVTTDTGQYLAPMQTSSERTEAYLARHQGSETLFITWHDSRSDSAGRILLGLTARGDTELHTEGCLVGIGWRATQDARIEQLQLDWRDSSFRTFDQGYRGVLPGLMADVYVLRADADVSTVSLRYGCQRPLSGNWGWMSAASVHSSKIAGNWRIRSSRGLGQDPQTHSEGHIPNGRVRMLALSLGLIYENERCAAAFTYTGGYAEVNDALKRLFHKERVEPGEGPTNKLKPNPVAALSAEWRF